MRKSHLLLLGLAGLARAASLQAAEEDEMMMMGGAKLDPKHVEFFQKKIQPIFKENCFKCHSLEANKAKGGLTMDTREGLAKGGDTGPAVKAGSPEKSLLISAVGYGDPDLQMPPKGEKLSKEQIADLTEWVKMGAPDPRVSSAAIATKLSGLTNKARSHWAFQPVKKPSIPAVKNRAWCLTPVDAFVVEKLEARGMTPSPSTDRETLLRRATYDLIGLPPTPKETIEFISDKSPDQIAFAKVVDRLLTSPHYGERWGRFWLDTARYSDTTGGETDQNRADYRYPFAWTYRDWVVKALNADMPYDRFIVHQLAADLVPKNPTENLAALGFLTVGELFGSGDDVINDRIDVVTKGFLAMTVSCARCHDHMFDPIPTTDYYALHGIFASTTEPREKPLLSTPEKKPLFEDFQKKLAALEQENRDKYYTVLGDYSPQFWPKAGAYLLAAYKSRGSASAEDQVAAAALAKEEKLEREIVNDLRGRMNRDDAIFGPLKRFDEGGDSWKAIAASIAENKKNKFNPIVAAAFAGTAPDNYADLTAIYGKIFAQVADKGRDYLKAAAATKSGPVPGFDETTAQLLNTPFPIEIAGNLTTDNLRDAVKRWPQQMRGKGGFGFAKINTLLLTHDGSPKRAMVVEDRRDPRNTQVMVRGQRETRGPEVPRRFLEVLSPGGKPKPFTKGSGRLELAVAIAGKGNPLTARVMVNRVWMHHFGEGFVRTPDDLGTQAELPTHPELIDYLSSYFMEQGWSLKKLHKLIMLSKVYQESSVALGQDENINKDPENRLLWRANVRRLEFEAVRDSLLVFAGKLDPTIGGQPVNLTDEPYSTRRSVYGYIDRGNLPELMAHFDFSRPDMPNSKRTTTVVPQQALFLMNSPMAADAARGVMSRPEITKALDNVTLVNAIYRVVFQRSPHPGEVPLAYAFVGAEKQQEGQVAEAAKGIVEKATKSAKERMDRNMQRENDAQGAIQNKGDLVERKPLTSWETYVQTLLLSNEAAYVN